MSSRTVEFIKVEAQLWKSLFFHSFILSFQREQETFFSVLSKMLPVSSVSHVVNSENQQLSLEDNTSKMWKTILHRSAEMQWNESTEKQQWGRTCHTRHPGDHWDPVLKEWDQRPKDAMEVNSEDMKLFSSLFLR